MVKVSNAPSEVAAICLDDDLLCVNPENSIIIFHESIFLHKQRPINPVGVYGGPLCAA